MSGDRFNNPTDYGQDVFIPQVDIVIPAIEMAHRKAMSAKRFVFQAQDATSQGWEKATPAERRTLRKFERRLAKVRAELEALDRDYLDRSKVTVRVSADGRRARIR